MFDPALVLGVLALEAVIGYPARWHQHISHPVSWAGTAIAALEARWNRPVWSDQQRKGLGMVTVFIVAGVAGLGGFVLERLLLPGAFGAALIVLLATAGLAQRSLHDHAEAVVTPLMQGDLPQARTAVARIVGRDVQGLDQSGVAAAGLESLAESFNDGVVAPAFWLLVAGLPGLFIYKVINTADSMIGHLEPRWRDFGWAAARSDDVLNLIPARIAGALIAVAARGGWRTMMADAMKHASPNAGWPEAAMAGALDVRLGGIAVYDTVTHHRPVFGEGPAPRPADLRRGLNIYVRACAVMWAALAAGGVLWRL